MCFSFNHNIGHAYIKGITYIIFHCISSFDWTFVGKYLSISSSVSEWFPEPVVSTSLLTDGLSFKYRYFLHPNIQEVFHSRSSPSCLNTDETAETWSHWPNTVWTLHWQRLSHNDEYTKYNNNNSKSSKWSTEAEHLQPWCWSRTHAGVKYTEEQTECEISGSQPEAS